jgi:hypothetical protein
VQRSQTPLSSIDAKSKLSDFRGTHIKEKIHDEDFVQSYHSGDSHLVLLCGRRDFFSCGRVGTVARRV